MNDFGTYYSERVAAATKEQGIGEIVEAMRSRGIEASAEQTGGFTMCAYVDLGNGFYIYANSFGAGLYDSEQFETDIAQFDEKQSAARIAEIVADYIAKR